MQPKLSMTALSIALVVGAAICYGLFLLYAAWIDGRRQKLREHGQHPVTLPDGNVEAREEEHNG